MRSQGKQKGQRRQKEGKMHFFHLFGASASQAAFYKNESSKNIARLMTNIDNDPGVRRVSP
jgi:hypothetical protein